MTDDETAFEYSETEILDEAPADGRRRPEATDDDFPPGSVIDDRYEILDVIGEGGMGRVFKAEDLTLHELVALKILNVEAASDPEAVQQFHREVKLARRVAHPNVVRTYDIGTTGDIPFLTMEYLKGDDLRRAMYSDAFDLADIVSTAETIAQGLSAAHEVGVLHRDLKPENVLIDESGRVALTDFGIAGALRSGGGRETIRRQGVGTPAYMAPEQLRGDEEMDQRVDIYAFGLLLFELVAGRLPWQADDPMTLAVARIDRPAPSLAEFAPDAPGRLVETVDAALHRDPDARPDAIDELRDRLDALSVADSPTAAPPARETPDPARAPTSEFDETRRWRESTSADQPRRVIVLPFDTRDLDDATEVASGIREDLIYRLGYWESVEVRLREAPADASLAAESARAVGREFDVDAVVRGDIRERDDGYRVRAAVVSVRTGDQVWSDVSTFRARQVNDVAAEMADAIGRQLTDSGPETAPDRLPTTAHGLLNKGRLILRRRWRSDVSAAIEPLERAREEAPHHPRVLSQLAVARGRMGFQNPEERESHIEKAVDLAREAIDRAGDQWAEPRYALATAHFYNRSYGRAVATLRAALEREPNYAEAYELLGRIQTELGPLDRAIEHLERARELNPYLTRVLPDLMRAYGFDGQWDAVDAIANQDLVSEYPRRARVLTALRLSFWRDRSSLRRLLANDRDLFDMIPREEQKAPFEAAFQVLETGDIDATVQRALDSELAAWPDSRLKVLMCQCGAEAAAYACEPDIALDFVDRAIDAGLTDLMWLRHCPVFDDYRDRPEFIRRHERIRGRVEALEYA